MRTPLILYSLFIERGLGPSASSGSISSLDLVRMIGCWTSRGFHHHMRQVMLLSMSKTRVATLSSVRGRR